MMDGLISLLPTLPGTRLGKLILAIVVASCFATITVYRTVAAQDGKIAVSNQGETDITRDESGHVRIRFTRGNRVDVGNRTTGPIVVVGWDRDYLEAVAMSDRGVEGIKAGIDDGPMGRVIRVKADYSDRFNNDFMKSPFDPLAKIETLQERLAELWASPWKLMDLGAQRTTPRRQSGPRRDDKAQDRPLNPSAPPPPLFEPPALDVQSASSTRPGEIFFEVRVPRYALLECIKVFRSEVLVYDVDNPVVVDGQRSIIRIGRVRSAEVHTSTGNIEVESVAGRVDVVTTSGAIRVNQVLGDVRALSVSGRIEIQCVRGKVDASNTDAPIILNGVAGDVTASATYSNLLVRGPLRSGGTYSLKSLSGSVQLELPPSTKGFTALLSSYTGAVESAFALKRVEGAAPGTSSKRLIGRYGDGQAQITLDSFDGTVRLVKGAANLGINCK
jgi:hypothetical protein